MKKLYFILALILFQSSILFSQVAINADGSAPHNSAGLDISFSDKGILLPRLTLDQRNAIQSPAEGLILYCTNCGSDGKGVLSFYQDGAWKVIDLSCVAPVAPTVAVHGVTDSQITWNWNSVPQTTGYKWNTTNDFSTATDLGDLTTFAETNLQCWTSYTRYVWAYNSCGISAPLILTAATQEIPIALAPAEGTHTATAYSIQWNWSEVTEATGYKWNDEDNYTTAIDLGINTTYAETGLTCNSGYTRYIWAYNNCGKTASVAISKVTGFDPPAEPTAAVHESYPNLIVWNWNTVSGASGYKWSTSNDFGTAIEMGSNTSKIESGLTCNTDYTRYIWSYGPCGVSEATVLSQATLTDPPVCPVAGTHVPSAFQVVWVWSAASGATGYKFSATNDYATAQDLGNNLTYTETGLNCNTGYTRYIWSYSDCGNSNALALVQTTSLNPPVAPTAGTHTPTPTQITWNWNTVSGATGYKWNTTNNESTAIDVGNTTTRLETGLTCNTSYTRYVWAYSNCGTSPAASLAQVTSLNPPPAPTAATHTATASQIVWNWNTVTGATGYKWNTSNNYSTAQDMGTSTSKTETGLNCNTAYTRYVWAYSNCGNSTSTSLVKTTGIETPASPVAGTHVPTNTQIVWNWNVVSGATGYKWSNTNDFATATDMGNVTSKTEAALVCGTTYSRYVWSYNACANSASVLISQTTASAPPASPAAGTHVANANQIVWNWTTVTGATSYKFNTTNNLGTATDVGNVTSYTETGLNCNTSYTRYIWAYNGCAASAPISVSQTTTTAQPSAPGAGTHAATPTQITWNWNVVADASGYKWSISNVYATATDLGNATSYVENGLTCNTSFIRYIWAYNSCGVSSSTMLAQTTANDPPAIPTEGVHEATENEIVWNWNTTYGAAGYKWNTTNDYATAIDMGTSLTRTETGLTCGTTYNRYVWAYSSCGNSTALTMTQISGACFACGTTLYVNHVAGDVAPVSKSTSYGTVTNVPGATTKCWITSNLGSDHQASAVNDATEASAGWYWQFNKKQGFKHDGTARTPNTTWINPIADNTNWTTENDPCALSLGTGWRLPTSTEWNAVDAGGSWTNWDGPWSSSLKLHAAGKLANTDGSLTYSGQQGAYWSSSQNINYAYGQALFFFSSSSSVMQMYKAYGFTVRCLRD